LMSGPTMRRLPVASSRCCGCACCPCCACCDCLETSAKRKSGLFGSIDGCGRIGGLPPPRPGVTLTDDRGSLRGTSSFLPKSASRLNIPVSLLQGWFMYHVNKVT
jgi:hypothetical protein